MCFHSLVHLGYVEDFDLDVQESGRLFLCMYCVLWRLWKVRNSRNFEGFECSWCY